MPAASSSSLLEPRVKRSAGEPAELEDPEVAEKFGERRTLLCAACGHEVTDLAAATAIDGRHDHRCVNPSGAIYDIGCFVRAPGVSVSGPPEAYFSWFRGYRWQLAHCRGCDAHLGWRFSREGAAFFGLILDRLHAAEKTDLE